MGTFLVLVVYSAAVSAVVIGLDALIECAIKAVKGKKA